MKSMSFALLAALLVPMAAQAQSYPIDRGSFLLDGNASLTSNKFGDGRSLTATFSPSVQYFFTPGVAFGGRVGVFYRSFDGSPFRSSSTSLDILLGPALHYYFGQPESRLYPFVGGSTLFNVSEFDESFSFTVEGGGAYLIARNVALTGAAFFTAVAEDLGDANSFGLRFGVSAFIY